MAAMSEVKLAITADATQFARQLRIIAKHVLALADELEPEGDSTDTTDNRHERNPP